MVCPSSREVVRLPDVGPVGSETNFINTRFHMTITQKSTRRIGAASALIAAIAMAVHFEGLSLKSYADVGQGIITACYGHTGRDVRAGEKYTLEQCKKWLSDDMNLAIAAVDRCSPGLPDGPKAAFADAVFNLGPSIVCDRQRSTVARHLRDGRLTDACNQLLRWDKARVNGKMVTLPGLTRRRQAERELCLKGLP